MPINWGLGVMPDVGQNALAAFERGRAQRKQDDYQTAAQAYAVNPTEQTFNALIPYASPEDALRIGSERQQQQAKLQDERHVTVQKALGQAALDIMSRPPEQRAAAWDAYAQQFASIDPSSAQSVGQYNEQAVMAIIAQNGLMGEYQAGAAPKYQVIPEGGTLVNTRDPQAVAQFGSSPMPGVISGYGGGTFDTKGRQVTQGQPGAVENKHMVVGQAAQLSRDLGPQKFIEWQTRNNVPVLVSSPEEAAALPPGALMLSPDGRIGVKR